MRSVDISAVLQNLRIELTDLKDPVEILSTTSRHAARFLQCDSALIRYSCDDIYLESESGAEAEGTRNRTRAIDIFTMRDSQLRLDGMVVPMPLIINDVARSRLVPELAAKLKKNQIFSICVFPLNRSQGVCGWLECRFQNRYHRWRKEDLLILQQMADYCMIFLEACPDLKDAVAFPINQRSSSAETTFNRQLDEARLEYNRLVEYGNLLIIKTNSDSIVTDVVGNTREILGVDSDTLVNDGEVWKKFLPGSDLRNLWRKISRMKVQPRELSEEVRVINRETGRVRWLMLRGIPLHNANGEFTGWEGFGLDITEKRQAQDDLLRQSKRVEALYEVSRALQVNLDPALVTLRGLRALITATNSDCGLGCFYDRNKDTFEIVATEGLSQTYIDGISSVINGQSVVRVAVQNREGYLIDNLQEDTRAAINLAKREGLKSTIVMPLIFEGTVLGCMAVFCRESGRYTEEDYSLVTAACSQISLVARQADLYALEKREARSLAALYRLSHELSKYFTPREVAEHAFPVILEEVPCKRMWLGVLNEQGTHIVGQAGYGPGMRQNIVKVQIELDLRHDFLDEALKKKQTIVVAEGQEVECSGLNRIMSVLNPGTFLIIPLVSIGQVVGVLVVEPEVNSASYAIGKIPLLDRMATEIGMVILARRFEARMADSDKMRMAGLLASGVAHNFNNLLQAVMGQASLIEMQLSPDSALCGSARMIIDAANRGASLVSHLLSFSSKENRPKKHINPGKMLSESSDFYRSILGPEICLEVEQDGEIPQIYGDYAQLQQAITNLLVNAREAIAVKKRADGKVRLTLRKVRLSTGEVDRELAPGNYLRVDVEDNGAGMDSERLSRCFEPFFTTKNADTVTGVGTGGSGLGLSSAYSIIRQHDGLITADSEAGQGCRFTIYLPVIISHLKGVISAEDTQLPLETVEVLGLALDETVGSSLRSFMQSRKLRTYLAQRRLEAVQVLKANAGQIRLFILDVDKWGDESLPFIAAFRQENADTPMVALTDQVQKWSDLLHSYSDVEIFEKPLSVWTLHSILRLVRVDEPASAVLADVMKVDKIEPAKQENPLAEYFEIDEEVETHAGEVSGGQA